MQLGGKEEQNIAWQSNKPAIASDLLNGKIAYNKIKVVFFNYWKMNSLANRECGMAIKLKLIFNYLETIGGACAIGIVSSCST